MFREKLSKDKDQRGYLYIRESVYKRDRRTLKRKPAKLCDGTAYSKRGKYSQKKDIYCGKIYEIDLEKLITFKEYISQRGEDYLKYVTESEFNGLIDDFYEYLFDIYKIDKEEFFSKTKKVYALSEGYISKDILEWLKRFNVNKSHNSPAEFTRFYYRCQDCGIFDEDVINILYLKLIPEADKKEVEEEIKALQAHKVDKKQYFGLKDFLSKND